MYLFPCIRSRRIILPQPLTPPAMKQQKLPLDDFDDSDEAGNRRCAWEDIGGRFRGGGRVVFGYDGLERFCCGCREEETGVKFYGLFGVFLWECRQYEEWKNAKRTYIQMIKRMSNVCVELGGGGNPYLMRLRTGICRSSHFENARTRSCGRLSRRCCTMYSKLLLQHPLSNPVRLKRQNHSAETNSISRSPSFAPHPSAT